MCRRDHSVSPQAAPGSAACLLDRRRGSRHGHRVRSGCISTSCASSAIRLRATDNVRVMRQSAVPASSDADQAADAGNRQRHDRGAFQARDRPGGDRQRGDDRQRRRLQAVADADQRSAGAMVLDEHAKIEPAKWPDRHANVARGQPAVLDLEGARRAASCGADRSSASAAPRPRSTAPPRSATRWCRGREDTARAPHHPVTNAGREPQWRAAAGGDHSPRR